MHYALQATHGAHIVHVETLEFTLIEFVDAAIALVLLGRVHFVEELGAQFLYANASQQLGVLVVVDLVNVRL